MTFIVSVRLYSTSGYLWSKYLTSEMLAYKNIYAEKSIFCH